MAMRMEDYGLVLKEEPARGGRRTLEIFYGPQHPSSGHMRIILEVDGDIIVGIQPDPGYVHRTMEKLGETRIYVHNIPLFERMSLPDAINVTWAYVMAVERLLDLDVSPRAEYLRTIFAELSRISTHLYDLGLHAIMIGSSTGFMWAYGLRELLVDLWAVSTGSRTTPSTIVPGGFRFAPPKAFYEKVLGYLDFLERKLDELVRLVIKNPVGYSRLKDVGYVSRDEAAKLGATGPGARGSGIDYDMRRDLRYGVYDQVEWNVVVEDGGDSLARTMVRIGEMRESARIIRQAIKDIPEGALAGHKMLERIPPNLRPRATDDQVRFTQYLTMRVPPGEAHGMTEGGRGRYFFHVVSDDSLKPYRVRISTPSWQNLRAFMRACLGSRLMDLPAIYGSFGYFPPEADR